MVGVFRVKNTILRQKIIFFPSFRGGGAGCAPPGSAPAIVSIDKTIYQGWIQDLWLGEQLSDKIKTQNQVFLV
jgi:hypothetical protein